MAQGTRISSPRVASGNCRCPQNRDLFLRVFESVRRRYRFVVGGYVVMPEHVHLLIGEPAHGNPSVVMKALKQGFERRLLARLRRLCLP